MYLLTISSFNIKKQKLQKKRNYLLLIVKETKKND